ncbi:MAG: isochorismatase hydrolase [Marmoricola sp.]|jgi:nicotinamidase-related amidase|nr:isochorismatase hydrolase [Marmoricola sp.]
MTNSALLVMDVQTDIVQRHPADPGYLQRINVAIAAARKIDVPVIYVVVGFRAGHPEISPRNKAFSVASSSGRLVQTDAVNAVHDAVAPAPGDVVVTKRRVSAFTGSDLEVVLRAKGIDELVLCGIATSGVVLSTLRQAADLDYGLVVLSDGCLDADEEVHRVLTEKVFPRQAEVMTIAEWAS